MSQTSAEKVCGVCSEAATAACGKCKRAHYCGKDCQLSDWAVHKVQCKKWVKEAKEAALMRQTAANWASGLSEADQYEWLCNCYQMRCDDDYVHGGGDLHGPYFQSFQKHTHLLCDFKIFCLLAQENGVIPEGWQWGTFLAKATKFVIFAFEKSDAQERWGSENIFSAMTGGRSLRYTGEKVYSVGVTVPDGTNKSTRKARELIKKDEDATLNKIGGRECWEKFSADLTAVGCVDGEGDYDANY